MLDREENRSVKENNDTKEFNRQPKEFSSQNEMTAVSEMTIVSEDRASSQSTFKKKLKESPKLQHEAFAATAVISLASFAVIATSGLVNVTMDGSINEITYQDNKICYNITVEDVHEENTLFFEVIEGSTVLMTYTIELENESGYDGDLIGSFPLDELNLSERMKDKEKLSFDVHLCGDTGLVNRTYDSWVFEVEALVSEFTKVEAHCDHENSGNFLFTMYFQDDYNLIKDFKATLTDRLGVTRECNFSDNLHEEQKIPVLGMCGGEATFELSYTINGVAKVEKQTVTL